MPRERPSFKKKEDQMSPEKMRRLDIFINNADGGHTEVQHESTSKVTFKSINLPLNEYIYSALELGSKKTERSKIGFIRNAILKAVEELASAEGKNGI